MPSSENLVAKDDERIDENVEVTSVNDDDSFNEVDVINNINIVSEDVKVIVRSTVQEEKDDDIEIAVINNESESDDNFSAKDDEFSDEENVASTSVKDNIKEILEEKEEAISSKEENVVTEEKAVFVAEENVENTSVNDDNLDTEVEEEEIAKASNNVNVAAKIEPETFLLAEKYRQKLLNEDSDVMQDGYIVLRNLLQYGSQNFLSDELEDSLSSDTLGVFAMLEDSINNNNESRQTLAKSKNPSHNLVINAANCTKFYTEIVKRADSFVKNNTQMGYTLLELQNGEVLPDSYNYNLNNNREYGIFGRELKEINPTAKTLQSIVESSFYGSIFTYANSNFAFIGKWPNDEPTGAGIVLDRYGNLAYIGTFQNAKVFGRGIELDTFGNILFLGEFKEGKRFNGLYYLKG